jgi:hypothetical protein
MANTRTNYAKLRQVDLTTVSAKVSERKRPTVVVIATNAAKIAHEGPTGPFYRNPSEFSSFFLVFYKLLPFHYIEW